MEALEQINFNAAGLDIGAAEIWVALLRDSDPSTPSRRIYTPWLAGCGRRGYCGGGFIGIYWIPTYQILEERGLQLFLVNARHIKGVTGRKTDIKSDLHEGSGP